MTLYKSRNLSMPQLPLQHNEKTVLADLRTFPTLAYLASSENKQILFLSPNRRRRRGRVAEIIECVGERRWNMKAGPLSSILFDTWCE